jgi:Mn2+/Fe2+ NRAMP family transporter
LKEENNLTSEEQAQVGGARASDTAQAQNSAAPAQKDNNFWHMLGPGLTTGASDDDPSGIATYSQTGARYGYSLLWLAAYTFPLMAIVQEMCARIGLVTGRGLAANIRLFYPRWVLYLSTALLFLANVTSLSRIHSMN